MKVDGRRANHVEKKKILAPAEQDLVNDQPQDDAADGNRQDVKHKPDIFGQLDQA